MSEAPGKNTVTVTIAGDDYTIRAEASSDYMRECAAYVDRTIAEIVPRSALVEVHKSAILAALSLTDQLFRARAETEALRREIARLAGKLTADIEAAAAGRDLASSP